MMTVSAFGSSVARACPVAVLVAGRRHAAANDVNSRYLIFTPLITLPSLFEILSSLLWTLLTDCLIGLLVQSIVRMLTGNVE